MKLLEKRHLTSIVSFLLLNLVRACTGTEGSSVGVNAERKRGGVNLLTDVIPDQGNAVDNQLHSYNAF